MRNARPPASRARRGARASPAWRARRAPCRRAAAGRCARSRAWRGRPSRSARRRDGRARPRRRGRGSPCPARARSSAGGGPSRSGGPDGRAAQLRGPCSLHLLVELLSETEPAGAGDGARKRRLHLLGVGALGERAAVAGHRRDHLLDEHLLEAERGLVSLLVGLGPRAHGRGQRGVGDGGKPGDSHRLTPLAISIMESAVWIAFDVIWKVRCASIMSTIACAMSVLEASSAPCVSCVSAGALRVGPDAAVATNAFSPTGSRPAVARTVTSWSLPTIVPLARTVPSRSIATWSSVTPSGILMVGSISPPVD